METTIDILKEILYFTDVGENNKYAEAILTAIDNLYEKDSDNVSREDAEEEIYMRYLRNILFMN